MSGQFSLNGYKRPSLERRVAKRTLSGSWSKGKLGFVQDGLYQPHLYSQLYRYDVYGSLRSVGSTTAG